MTLVNNWKKLGILLLFFGIVLFTRNTMISESLIGVEVSQIIVIALFGVWSFVFLFLNRKKWKEIFTDCRIACVIGVSAVILFPMLLKGDWQLMYFSVLSCIVFGIISTYFIKLEELGRYYVLIMTIIAVYSLVATYCLKPLVESGLIHVPEITNVNGMPFLNFSLAYVVDIPGYYRNFGLFREPGIYQFFIILALYTNNYIVERWESKRIWIVNLILFLTMLTTFSTNGIIELGLFMLVMFFDKKMYKNRCMQLAAIGLIVLMVIALIVVYMQKGMLYWTIYSMFEKIFRSTDSSSVRVESICVDLDFFIRNPLVGTKISEVFGAVLHNTTSTMLMFAIFGILGGLLSLSSWVALAWQGKRSMFVNIAYLVIFLMSFNAQNMIADVFFWLFPIMALMERMGLSAGQYKKIGFKKELCLLKRK